jgi:hypothetical protein
MIMLGVHLLVWGSSCFILWLFSHFLGTADSVLRHA